MEDVVIAGIAGKLPESENLQEFWENLLNGVDMVTEDDRRWKPGECFLSLLLELWVLTILEELSYERIYWMQNPPRAEFNSDLSRNPGSEHFHEGLMRSIL